MAIRIDHYELWFVTGSQHLYGEEVLKQVLDDSTAIAKALDASPEIPVRVVCKPVLTRPDTIRVLCLEANQSANCVGLIAWMHTFSPAKMWIAGLNELKKPFLHLHTQFNRDIPWSTIDMDFMNLNQSAQGLRIARFGDNMREVAVTEGDKVGAQMQLGWSVNGYGLGDLVAKVNAVGDAAIDALVREYHDRYTLTGGDDARASIREAARIELGLRAFLEEGSFQGFTTTFENLHGLHQLPGLAVQRLMAEGYGFGAEGDWKTAALLRAMKVMATCLKGGTSFMEDYTYHLEPGGMQVLGAHMLEICESIADGKPSLEVHPLSIGGKADPARLVFNVAAGPAINASIIDMGNRFRLLINEVDVVAPADALPKLPVARALWAPKPNLKVAAAAWILAGGAHHTGFSQSLTAEHLTDFAEMAGLELVIIDGDTGIRGIKQELRWNEALYS